MTSDAHGPDGVGRLTPSDVQDALFLRAGLGRRGYDEVEVDVFLERVQDELARLLAERAELRDEVARLRSRSASDGSEPSPFTGPDREELDRQVAYLQTFGQVVRVQLKAYLEALLRDVEQEWGRADPGVVLPAPGVAPDHHRNGHARVRADAAPVSAPSARPEAEPLGDDLVNGEPEQERPRDPERSGRKRVTMHSR